MTAVEPRVALGAGVSAHCGASPLVANAHLVDWRMTQCGHIAHWWIGVAFLLVWRDMRRVVPLGGNEALFIHGLYLVLVTSWAVEELPVHSVHLVGVDADAYLSAPCSSASHSVGIMSCVPFAGG